MQQQSSKLFQKTKVSFIVSIQIPVFVPEKLLHLVNKLKSLQLLSAVSHLDLAITGKKGRNKDWMYSEDMINLVRN